MIYNLHVLRVIAALAVVYYHSTSDAGLNLELSFGSRGVDVFFVISGFIIAYIGSNNPKQFLRRRMLRVVPFYWAATLVVFAIACVLPNLFHQTRADVPQLVCSLLFLPRETSYAGLFPTLILGWSLNYEMYFYFAFTGALALSKRYAPLVCCGIIAVILVVINLIGTDNPSVGFYGRGIVLEFAYGIGVYYAMKWIELRKEALVRFAAGKWLLLLVVVGALGFVGWGELNGFDEYPRYLVAGIPAFFIVLGAILLERIYGWKIDNKTVYLLGEASYILYLVHPYVIYTILRLGVTHLSLTPVTTAVVIAGLLAVSSAVAMAIHVAFERPVMAALRARLL